MGKDIMKAVSHKEAKKELNKIQWGDMRTNGSWTGQKSEIFETIQHIDKALSES